MSPEATARETVIACLTPPGAGAIATVALWGPQAWDVTRTLFRPRGRAEATLPAEPERGRIWLGRWGEETTDDVVLVAKETQPVPCVEIHCHGGREVVRLLFETAERRGLRSCSWQEFEQCRRGDRLDAAAALALAHAATVRTAGILLDQYHGAFRQAVEAILASWANGDQASAANQLEALQHYTRLGRHLTEPWRVVVAGAANVGKSSLINALVGAQRSVVAPTAGTTRDLVTARIAVDGWPVELVDTAGLRAAAGSIEQQGMLLARQALETADLCVWVVDASTATVWPAETRETIRLVINKVDLPAAWEREQASGAVRVSAVAGTGIVELAAALAAWLVPDAPPPGAAVPFSAALAVQFDVAWHHHLAGQRAEAQRVLAELLQG